MIQLNYRDNRPFYQQIKDNIRQLVISKALLENEKLPSVREMAAFLAINPNTIQRAYRELENEGYVYTVTGKGTFVAKVSPVTLDRQKDLLDKFDNLVSELLFLSTPVTELTGRILTLSEGGKRT